ncbi:MAG TPA: hypothetical protein VK423_01595, partial [Thermoplasmata archaeon]|nr:hypothetical protein [Thermoplasmata archaeon]
MDRPLQRTGAERRVETGVGEQRAGRGRGDEPNPPVLEAGRHLRQLKVDDLFDLGLGERVEDHHLVEA